MRKNSVIGIRLPTGDRQKIERLVESGQYKNLSDVIRGALTRFLKDASE